MMKGAEGEADTYDHQSIKVRERERERCDGKAARLTLTCKQHCRWE